MKRWLLRISAAAILAAAFVGCAKREDIKRLMATTSLFNADKIVTNFSNMDDLFLTRPIGRGTGPVSPLPKGPEMTMPAGYDAYIADRQITGIVVLHAGKIVHEAYYQDTQPEDLRIAWSVSKSWLSALIGILLDEGAIGSIEDPVIQYAPALIGSAYETAKIKDVLRMSSGVVFDENYAAFNSDINKMGRVLALGGSMDGFAAAIDQSAAAPGERWQYVSIDTHVLGMVVRGATGRTVPDLMSEKIVQPLGLEAEPYYAVDGEGVAFALGGINIRTRDSARFGQMIAQNGNWQGREIVPADWIKAATRPSAPNTRGVGYGYQWWIPDGAPDGVFYAHGVYGQYIFVNQTRDVVIAVNAADRFFLGPGAGYQNMAMFAAISRSFE